jgi:DNA polymerase III subunit epsilon
VKHSETMLRASDRFRAAVTASPDTPWRDADWLAVDLELTGLNPRRHEIVAIGAVPIRAGRVILGESLYTLVRPAHPSEVEAVLIHKLRSEDLADAPPLHEGLELLLDRLAGAVPVFHTAAVEQAFLGRELRERDLRLPAAADTEVLGRLWQLQRTGKRLTGLQLARLASLLGQRPEPPHHALADAITTANAFIALASHLSAVRPETVGSLQSADARLRPGRRFGPG